MKFKVLIVDDDPIIRRFLTELLESEGHTVVIASTGLEGVLKATSDIDVIIMDMMMPVFDGLSTCNRLKEDPQTARIPILFLTGYNDEKVLKACSESGNALLRKPVTCEALLSKLAELMANRKIPV